MVGFVTLALAACSSQAIPPSPPPTPGPRAIEGIYFQHDADGTGNEVVEGVAIGLFREAFVPGSLQYRPPQPIARSTTLRDGRFGFTGLAAGRYWVVPIDQRVAVSGQWVHVTDERGASLILAGCTDCPPPS